MGLFDDLLPAGHAAKLTPGAAARGALERELERRRDAWVDKPGYIYRGAGDMLLRHGSYYEGRVLPDQHLHLRGQEARCYANALEAVQADPTLRYVEGVYSTGASYYTTHAWAIEPDGSLLELTYPTRDLDGYINGHVGMAIMPPEHWAYWGVIVHPDYVQAHLDALGLPMLDRGPEKTDPRAMAREVLPDLRDNPFLKVPYDPNRTSL